MCEFRLGSWVAKEPWGPLHEAELALWDASAALYINDRGLVSQRCVAFGSLETEIQTICTEDCDCSRETKSKTLMLLYYFRVGEEHVSR